MTTGTLQPPAPTSEQKKAETTIPALARFQSKTRPLPDALALPRAVFYGCKTPRTVGYLQGSAIAFMQSAGKGVTLDQNRRAFAMATNSVQSGAGLGTPEQKAQWVKHISNENWSAFWMPFQDQTHKVTSSGKAANSKQEQANIAKAKKDFVSQSRVGEGCDLVVFYIHGGGFVQGDPLQSLDLFRNVMRKVHQLHDVKVGYFSVQYRFAPETPFPGPLEDCLVAYRALIKEYGVDPKRIVFGGESAGGNLSYALALKVRDEFSHELPLPAAIYTSSPYFPWKEKLEWTLFDTISPENNDLFVDAYTQQRPEVLTHPHYNPLNAISLAGLPPTLVIWSHIEVLAIWVDMFVEKARKDGVEVETMVKPDRPHCWFMVDPVSTVEDREEGAATIAKFLAKAASV
ncbi:hypothetical protein BG015_001967 [Linnemannia schmuckeri]|uniref:Alpha/beta hydrolase fold-3 domain-containing protein n=1 Tax=Linnemannia schmuckeri TaxID=64567 RepID=A0A9P5V6G4_9FUNG|nr:hypothetical protein BG015_001967 [Linnemannia schmuckeri]